MQRAAVWLPFCVILLVLCVVSRQVHTGVGVELLEFDLGFEAVLGFHDYVYQFVAIGVPFLDAAQIPGADHHRDRTDQNGSCPDAGAGDPGDGM